MESIRTASPQELRLINLLIEKAAVTLPHDWQTHLLVQPMEDGGMGSLRLFHKQADAVHRSFGRQLSEVQFKDADGVDVIASLNADKEGNLSELDIWKTDFSPLIRLPDERWI